jgi:hypothetical protein
VLSGLKIWDLAGASNVSFDRPPEKLHSAAVQLESTHPVSLSIWFVLAKPAAGALSSAVPVMKFIVDQFKQRGIKNVSIVLADGTKIQADDISVDNLLKIEQAAKSAR